MNEDERSNELPISEADTTPPNPANSAVPSPGKGWQMPEPKFQQTSGYLPQGYLDKVAFDATPPASVSPAAAAPAPTAEQLGAPAPEVEPQPEVLDHHDDVPAPTPIPAAKARSAASRVLLIILGLLAMAAFLVIFLAVVYYLFLAPQNGGSPF